MACTHAQFLPGTSWSPGSAAVTCCQTAAIKTELAVLGTPECSSLTMRRGSSRTPIRGVRQGRLGYESNKQPAREKSGKQDTVAAVFFQTTNFTHQNATDTLTADHALNSLQSFRPSCDSRPLVFFPLSPASIANPAVTQRTRAPLGHPTMFTVQRRQPSNTALPPPALSSSCT